MPQSSASAGTANPSETKAAANRDAIRLAARHSVSDDWSFIGGFDTF